MTPTGPMTEDTLVNGIRSGDPQAVRELVHHYGNRILQTCYRFMLNREDAEDLTQEVFIEIMQSASSFRFGSRLSTWVYRIAVTKCLDEIKKRKRKKRISSAGRILHLDKVADWITGGSRPEAALEEKESMAQVQAALDRLPDNQRVAFTLSRINGYSNEEIAEIMKISKTAVESLVHRAKVRMKDLLEQMIQNSSGK